MPEQGEGPKPGPVATFRRITPPETASRNKDNAAHIPSTALTTEPRGWYDRPHVELVGAFKGFIKERYERFGGFIPPEEIIRQKLDVEATSSHLPSDAPPEEQRRAEDFFFKIRQAWDAVAYDRYEPGSSAESIAGSLLHLYAGSRD